MNWGKSRWDNTDNNAKHVVATSKHYSTWICCRRASGSSLKPKLWACARSSSMLVLTRPPLHALWWIIANIVKHLTAQETLYSEIRAAIGPEVETVKQEDLQKLLYLKAMILERLRQHPPGHILLPHSVIEDTELDGFLVPKRGTINFIIADIGWDPPVWEDPMAFKPERFLSNGQGSGRGRIRGVRHNRDQGD
ncbi:hypothetical protein CDL15_Pgr018517 [Punica granatum]|uniref:Uncharacterized protein n=1 Tax=Punica granatum TaxID=22663 RepID=A0A218WZG4_PUNGR|nr:hypothetical protein CDL15_Pgr018517 [Punica granatum]